MLIQKKTKETETHETWHLTVAPIRDGYSYSKTSPANPTHCTPFNLGAKLAGRPKQILGPDGLLTFLIGDNREGRHRQKKVQSNVCSSILILKVPWLPCLAPNLDFQTISKDTLDLCNFENMKSLHWRLGQ